MCGFGCLRFVEFVVAVCFVGRALPLECVGWPSVGLGFVSGGRVVQ